MSLSAATHGAPVHIMITYARAHTQTHTHTHTHTPKDLVISFTLRDNNKKCRILPI